MTVSLLLGAMYMEERQKLLAFQAHMNRAAPRQHKAPKPKGYDV